ncbi:MAG TPA: VWA domain-containing protein, partial [Candidatus Limnocylindrales bacterium]
EPLVLVYPSEGIVTADYPLMLLNAAKRDAWQKVVDWLRTPEIQKRIMTDTARRPSIPAVALDSRFTTQTLIELPYPAKLDTINALITAYLDQVRKPSSAIFVLDLSGSMAGARLDALKQSLRALTGTDTSLTGTFSRFRAREQVTMITFSGEVLDTRTFTIDDTNPTGPDMTAIRNYVDGLTTYSNTAIYDGLEAAYRAVAQQQAADPNRLYSVVLMTDGENNAGLSADQFASEYQALPASARAVSTFPILFGEASVQAMQSIADLTGGKLFDAQNSSLETVFKQIRGYE